MTYDSTKPHDPALTKEELKEPDIHCPQPAVTYYGNSGQGNLELGKGGEHQKSWGPIEPIKPAREGS
jgi:hypothetical protein